ncbi:hypothetical protein [Culturomica massiliensis]|uniref:hypothetical protein n=1 Tax=Culturomica massiliensis TaxID=1841857 RepID=UPI002353AE53|nr:hypothetical protein [Culturomica massiliensis]
MRSTGDSPGIRLINSGTTPAGTVHIPQLYRSCTVVYVAIGIRRANVVYTPDTPRMFYYSPGFG